MPPLPLQMPWSVLFSIVSMLAFFYLGRRFERRSLLSRGLLWRSRELDVSDISVERLEEVNALLESHEDDLCVCGHERRTHRNPFKPGMHCTRLECGCAKYKLGATGP